MWTKSERSTEKKRHDIGNLETETIGHLNDLVDLLGTDPKQNIRTLVQQTGKLVTSVSCLYNRLDGETAELVCWAGYQLPPDLPPQTTASGHICFEATIKNSSQPTVIEDISKTSFEHSDPLVTQYGIKAYLGCPVFLDGQAIGSLCIVDTQTRLFNEAEIEIVSAMAKAISLEEQRLAVETEMHENEIKYRRLHTTMRLLADNIPDLIWSKDLEGRYTFANQALCDKVLKCHHPNEAIGKTDQYFSQREGKAGYEHIFGQNSLASDQRVQQQLNPERYFEEGLVRNQRLILDIYKAPYWDDRGNLIGTVACARDVTTEKKNENALQQSEQRYRNLYCNTPVMLFSLDRDDRITSVSNQWLDTMGYQHDEVIGRRIIDFFTTANRHEALEKILPDFYKTGQISNQPCQLFTKAGDTMEVLLSALAERDTQGNYIGAMASIVNLSDMGLAEKKNKQLSVRLQQAQKMESIATLAGGIAHQFNNALAVILGNLELIHMDGLDGENLKRFVDPIDEAGHRMVQLTSQLLAFARGGKFQTQTLPAHTFVRNTLQLVSHSMASNVDLETNLDETTEHIEVDQTQMQMLLAAILANASEAIEEQGKIRITLSNTQVTEQHCARYPGLQPGPMVRLRISDSGKGMDEDTRARIFEPFFTTKFTGRGLGMAAVYGIVKKHNGFIYVDSELNQGTTVTIYLRGVPPVTAVQEETPMYSPARTGTALIIEDEEMVMDVSRAIVAKLGYHILEATSGEQAVELAKSFPGQIDFALLDIILPDMNGNQIYPLLMKARPDLKVIVCTGFAQDGPAEEILKAGANSFIQKPFNTSTLSAALKSIFQGQEE
jgi:PAS domain S-box-containing protein